MIKFQIPWFQERRTLPTRFGCKRRAWRQMWYEKFVDSVISEILKIWKSTTKIPNVCYMGMHIEWNHVYRRIVHEKLDLIGFSGLQESRGPDITINESWSASTPWCVLELSRITESHFEAWTRSCMAWGWLLFLISKLLSGWQPSLSQVAPDFLASTGLLEELSSCKWRYDEGWEELCMIRLCSSWTTSLPYVN